MLLKIVRGLWAELTNTQPFPTEAVKRNLAVMDDAVTIAGRLKKENPDHNRRTLITAAEILDIDLFKESVR